MAKHTHCGYGHFPGGDPRTFSPDPESCSEKEIAAHREACYQWNLGNRPQCPPGHGILTDDSGKAVGFWDGGAFGIGTYEYECDGQECEGEP